MSLNNSQKNLENGIPVEVRIASTYFALTDKDYGSEPSIVIDDLSELLNKKPKAYSEGLDLREFKKLVTNFLKKYEIPEDKVKSMRICFLPEGILTQLVLTEPITINNNHVTIVIINRRKNVKSKNAIIDDTTLRIFDKLDGC